MNWLLLAIVAAILFGVSPLFMKSGVKKTNAYIGATLWLTVMTIFAFVETTRSKASMSLSSMGPLRLLFLLISGLALAGTVIFMFKAFKDGEAMKVAPILSAEYFVTYMFNHLLSRVWPSIPRIVVLVVILISIVLMATKSKGRGGNRWLCYSLLSMGFLVLSDYLYVHHVGGMNLNFKRLCLIGLAALVSWGVTLATGSFKAIRNMAFLEGLYLIASVFILYMANSCAKQSVNAFPHVSQQMILFSSLVATLIFGCVCLKERITTQYVIGIVLFEASCALWLGYIPTLSAML